MPNTPLSKKGEHIEASPERSVTEQRCTTNTSQLVSQPHPEAESGGQTTAGRPIFDADELSELLMNKEADSVKALLSR